jgi:reactive intermediate/imine deaminase
MAPKNIEIITEDAPDPLGPYSQAVLAGNTLYCSGNIAIDPKTGEIVGDGDVQEETRQVLKNMNAVLAKAGASPANVVRCTVFLDNLQNFVRLLLKGNAGMPFMFLIDDVSFSSFLSSCGTRYSSVLHVLFSQAAVNEIYAEYFKDSPVAPSRSCVQAAALPKGVQVEIDCIAVL